MLKVLVVEDEEMIRRGIVLAVDWAEQTQPLSQRWLKARGPVRWASALALLLATAVFGCYGPGYDAQSFIYFQF